MRLYLVQDGEAKSEAEDPERSLTMRGKGRPGKSPAPQKGWASVLRESITAARRAEKTFWKVNEQRDPDIKRSIQFRSYPSLCHPVKDWLTSLRDTEYSLLVRQACLPL